MRGKRRSEISKRTWRARKRAGGKGKCAFCHKAVYAGGVRREGKLHHKTCRAAKRAGLKPRHIGRNPVMANIGNPRPPAEWWTNMRAKVGSMYPRRSAKDKDMITAGIWWGYTPATRRRLIAKYG